MNLIFYDTETTGTDPYFDQILQFAALKTDENFNEVDRFEIRCRLLSHIVPHPKAMLVTGITAEMLIDPKLPSHYEMMTAVRQKLESWGPAIFIGYNSMRFDEAMLRSAFYQTLHPIYLTNTNGNGRADALLLMQAASVFAPGVLNIPIKDNGKSTFALDQLAPANDYYHENAHDALADVEATMFMTKKVANAAPDLWKRVRGAAEKRLVQEFLDTGEPFLLTEFFYNKGYTRPVVSIGQHPNSSNTIFAVSLEDGFDELVRLTDAELTNRLATSPRPVRRIKTNAAPLLTSLGKATAYPQFQALDMAIITNRTSIIRSDPALRQRLIAAMVEIEGLYEIDADAEIEERIYAGFYSRRDEQLIAEFHSAAWADRLRIAERFEDDRLQVLAKRLIYFSNPTLLPEEVRREIESIFARRFMTDEIEPGWLTPAAAITALEDLRLDLSLRTAPTLSGLLPLYETQARAFTSASNLGHRQGQS